MHSRYNQKQLKQNRLKTFFFEKKTSNNISEVTKFNLIAKYSWQKIYNIEFSIKDAIMQI